MKNPLHRCMPKYISQKLKSLFMIIFFQKIIFFSLFRSDLPALITHSTKWHHSSVYHIQYSKNSNLRNLKSYDWSNNWTNLGKQQKNFLDRTDTCHIFLDYPFWVTGLFIQCKNIRVTCTVVNCTVYQWEHNIARVLLKWNVQTIFMFLPGDSLIVRKWTRNLRAKIRKHVPKRNREMKWEMNAAFQKHLSD